MLRLLIITFLFLLNAGISAQSNASFGGTERVYPIRQGHKVGYIYIKEYGTIECIPPKYDYIGDTDLPWNTTSPGIDASPFRLYQIDEKVGLLDTFLQEILPNNYKRIRPISNQYFAVEIDSLFQLIDSTGRVIDDNLYQNICPADSPFRNELQYLFVQKNNRWGIRKLNGPMILDHQYTDIQSAGETGYYKVKKTQDTDLWQLINIKGEAILPKGYRDILVLDENLIAVKIWEWQLFVRNLSTENPEAPLRLRKDRKYKSVVKINETLAALSEKAGATSTIELWDIEQQKAIQIFDLVALPKNRFAPEFIYLDDQFSIQTDLVNTPNKGKVLRKKLVDNKGEIRSIGFDAIITTNRPHVYLGGYQVDGAFGNSKWEWTLLSPPFNIDGKAAIKYDEIFPFYKNLAITKDLDKYGLLYLSEEGKMDTLDPVFTYVDIVSDLEIHVQLGQTNVRYTMEDGKFKETLFMEARAIPKDKTPKLKEAGIQASRLVKKNEPQLYHTEFNALSTEVVRGGIQIIGHTGDVIEVAGGTRVKVPFAFLKTTTKYTHAFELSPAIIGLHYKDQAKPETDFGNRVLDWEPASVDLHNIVTDSTIEKAGIIGIRKFDARYEQTAFIDSDGQMGLIDHYGKQVSKNGMPLRYTYIGPFHRGKAAACIGGQLELNNKKEDLEGIVLTDKVNFIKEFHIRPAYLKGKDKSKFKKIYLTSNTGNKAKWVYINSDGDVVLETNADFAHDFNEEDQTAFIDILIETENNIGQKFTRTRRGLIDEAGQIILAPEYNSIRRYRSHYLVSKSGTPTISFTEKGHQIRKNPTRLRPFSGALSVFRGEHDSWGYINKSGEVTISPQFKIAKPFSEERALVMGESGEFIFINTKGEKIFGTGLTSKNLWRMVGDFKNGRCWFKEIGPTLKWGFYDKQGNVVLEPTFYFKPTGRADIEKTTSLPMDFSNGVAAVYIKNEKGDLMAAIIDTLGNYIVKPTEYAVINRFDHNGYATIKKNEEGPLGLLNAKGEIICTPKYKRIENFVNGYARVRNEKGKWGIIDQSGREIIPTSYIAVDTLSEGLVAVMADRRGWQYVDANNKTIIKGPFNKAPEFVNGISFVEKDNKKWIINNNGEKITLKEGRPYFLSDGILGVEVGEKKNKKYYYADAFGNNLFGRYFTEISPFHLVSAKVKTESDIYNSKRYNGAINKQGVMVVPPKFNTLHFQPDGTIIVNPQVYKGIVSKKGEVLLPVAYDQVLQTTTPATSLPFSQRNQVALIFRVEDGEKIGYIRMLNDEVEWLWELQN